MPTWRPKLWLCVAPASVCALDAAVTLIFQPATYWSGDLETVNEISMIDRWMLVQHPLVFVGWVLAWITAFSMAILWLPLRASQVFALTLILGNAAGASSWIIWRITNGFWICNVLFLTIGALVVVTWREAGMLSLAKGARAEADRTPRGT